MAAVFSSLVLLAKRCWTRWRPTLPEPPVSVTNKVADKIQDQDIREYHKKAAVLDSNGVRVPANIRRRFLGSKMFKLDRDD